MIYLDNNATTRILPEVKNAMLEYLVNEYGNPSSKYYDLAENAKQALAKARENVAKIFECYSDEVVFTSGATESNNMILKGVAEASNKRRIITSNIEHASIRETLSFLSEKGYEIVEIQVDEYGKLNLDELENSLNSDALIVSLGWVNGEIGVINEIEQIAKICSEHKVQFHVDATQAVGKINVKLPKGVDYVSFSGHKIYGPKGIGAAIIRKDDYGNYPKITPLIHGGEQEFGLRAGTQSVHNIVGLSKACEILLENFEKNLVLLKEKENFILQVLSDKLGSKLHINKVNNKVDGTLSFRIEGIKNMIFLKKISPYIAASAGSACSLGKPSHVLKAIGLNEKEIQETIRFSLSPYDDISEIINIL